MLAAFKSNPAPIFRLDWGVNELIPEWKGSVFQVLEGSAPVASPWGGEMAIATGDVLLTAGTASVGEMVVLVPWGHGRPMLGRVTTTGFVAEPGSVPCSPRRWRIAGRLVAHLRPRVRGRGKVLDFPGGDRPSVQGANTRGSGKCSTMELVWSNSRSDVKRVKAPSGPGDASVLAEQVLVAKSTKCHRARGVMSSDSTLAEHCLSLVEPGGLLIVQPGAESVMRGLVGVPKPEPKPEQLPLFLGS